MQEILWNIGWKSLQELETPEGILASGRHEVFGCIFGRDSLISALGLISLFEKTHNPYFLTLTEKILRTMSRLQGTTLEIESGEEPGKIIHEFRPDNHEHLTKSLDTPWFVYSTGEMRSYDSVDATPLYLMTAHAYLRAGGNAELVEELLPNIRAALMWLLTSADNNSDGFIDYWLHPKRRFGGLKVQSWMDSTESLFYEEGGDLEQGPRYPIAPVEVQGYAWAAFASWGEYFIGKESVADQEFGEKLTARAQELKERFNNKYVEVPTKERGSFIIACALDGEGRPLLSARSSMGHLLWASYKDESILKNEFIGALRDRLLAADLFVPEAGIRTLSTTSRKFDPISYHNGSIWPHDTAMLALGLENFGYSADANSVRQALLNAYRHYQTPIELFGYEHGFKDYKAACRTQAWSTVALLSILEEGTTQPESNRY